MRAHSRYTTRLALATTLWFALFSSLALAATAPRQFDLPGHGRLDLTLPDSWQSQVRSLSPQLPPTIVLTPASGEPFQLLITVVWPLGPGVPLPGIEAIREQVAAAAGKISAQSVEKTLPLKELRGKTTRGYCFSATDSNPKPGEFKYLTQGMVQVGAVNLAFAVLTNDADGATARKALEMIKHAVHVPGN